MINIKRSKEYAYKLLGVALETNELIRYIVDIPPYEIIIKNESGENVDCTFLKMEAIYKHYNDHFDFHIDKLFEETLDYWTLNIKGPGGFINVLNFPSFLSCCFLFLFL